MCLERRQNFYLKFDLFVFLPSHLVQGKKTHPKLFGADVQFGEERGHKSDNRWSTNYLYQKRAGSFVYLNIDEGEEGMVLGYCGHIINIS